MHSRLEELSAHIDRHRAELRDAVAAIPSEHLATTPSEGVWSVLGVLEHLAIVEGRIGIVLQKQIDEAKAGGAVGPDTDESPVIPTLNTEVFIDRSRKLKASDAAQPKYGRSLDELWQSLDQSRATIHSLLASAEGLNLSELKMPHPVFGPIDLYRWFAFVGSHEARHAAQIREIGESLASGS